MSYTNSYVCMGCGHKETNVHKTMYGKFSYNYNCKCGFELSHLSSTKNKPRRVKCTKKSINFQMSLNLL